MTATTDISGLDVLRALSEGVVEMPPAAVLLGWKALDLQPGHARVQYAARPDFCNPHGAIQGGFLDAMLDDAMGPALFTTLPADQFAPTIEMKVNFVRPARPGPIIAEGRSSTRRARLPSSKACSRPSTESSSRRLLPRLASSTPAQARMDIPGKVALVTGAGYGIGRGIARQLAVAGAQVVVNDVHAEHGRETASMIESAGGKAAFVHADVTRDDEIQRMVAFAEENFGGLDVL